MSRLMITKIYGFTPTEIRKWQKKQTGAHLRSRLTTIRLIMEGWTGKEAAHLCNFYRQSASIHVKKLN